MEVLGTIFFILNFVWINFMLPKFSAHHCSCRTLTCSGWTRLMYHSTASASVRLAPSATRVPSPLLRRSSISCAQADASAFRLNILDKGRRPIRRTCASRAVPGLPGRLLIVATRTPHTNNIVWKTWHDCGKGLFEVARKVKTHCKLLV